MKKSVIVISAIIAASAVLFTSCNIGKPVIKDVEGNKHVLYTDENGEVFQDYLGNVFEYKTKKNGEKVTEVYSYPEVVTNKSLSKIENCWVSIDVPKDWKANESTTLLRISHTKGDCVDLNQSGCQIDFETHYDTTLEEKYDKYYDTINNLYSLTSDIINFNESEIKICGKDAKVISYSFDSTDMSVYYYVLSNGFFTYTIKAAVYDNCFKDSQAVVDFLETCITMKNVVNVTNTTTTTAKGE